MHVVHHIREIFWINKVIALGIQLPSVSGCEQSEEKDILSPSP